MGDIRLYDSGEIVRAEEDGLFKLLPAQHLQWDVHTLEGHACDSEAGEIARSRQKSIPGTTYQFTYLGLQWGALHTSDRQMVIYLICLQMDDLVPQLPLREAVCAGSAI